MPVSNRRFGAELLAALAIAFSLCGSAAWADEPVVTTKPVPPALPEVFAKPAPESIADLKALEGHLSFVLVGDAEVVG